MAGSLDMPRREGRAPRMQAAARRAQILAEAVRVFSDSGYGATSTAAIAQNCGVSEPALYRYFSSKRELYLAALDEASARVLRRWQEISKESGGALGGLLAIGQWYFLQVEEEPELLRLRARADVDAHEPDVRERQQAFFLEAFAFVLGLYEDAEARGELPPETDLRVRTWFFLALGSLIDRTEALGLRDSLGFEELGRLILLGAPELLAPPVEPG